MQWIGTSDVMQQIDKTSIEEIGIPGIVLMEKAALSMEEEICHRYPTSYSVVIVTEKGNNGGDGLALGRLLLARGYKVQFYEIGGVRRASESYQIQKNILDQLGVEFCPSLPEGDQDTQTLWVDAVFGVGLTRDVKGIQKEVIEELNRREGTKIAVDVPSGVDASSGRILGCAFRADLTLTFGLSKVGLLLYPGASFAGEVVVKDIGFPREAVRRVSPDVCTFDKTDLRLLPSRSPWSNKGDYGRVLLIAGGKNMAGAAWLSAEAAYRSGSGLVHLFTCEENREILQMRMPEAVMTTWQSEEDAVIKLKEVLPRAAVIGIGPGLGTAASTGTLLRTVLTEGKVPLVIDADAINVLAADRSREHARTEPSGTESSGGLDETEGRAVPQSLSTLYKQYENTIILTPHMKEMERFSGISVKDIKADPIRAAKEAADETHIFVLKDARTVVSDGGEVTYINTSGNHGMSVGGSGDVLTGILCGLLAGGLAPRTAARLGVYCHGLIGDAAAEEKGCYGMLAGDMVSHICDVIR